MPKVFKPTDKAFSTGVKVFKPTENARGTGAVIVSPEKNVNNHILQTPAFKAVRGEISPAQSLKEIKKQEQLKTTIPSKTYVSQQGNKEISAFDKIILDSAKEKLFKGENLNASERGLVGKYGLSGFSSLQTSEVFDLFANDNPQNTSRFEKIKIIKSKEDNGKTLTEEEKDFVETTKLINSLKKGYASNLSSLTADINQNATKMETSKAMDLYNDAAYNDNEVRIGNRTFKVDENDATSKALGKKQQIKNRLNLYVNTGLDQYVEGVENTFDVFFGGVRSKEMAERPDSAYAMASNVLRQYYLKNNEQANVVLQDVVTNVAQNAVPIIVSIATAGITSGVSSGLLNSVSKVSKMAGSVLSQAPKFASQTAFAASCFGNSYKEGARMMETPSDGRVFAYAALTTSAEVCLNSLFDVATYGTAKLVGYKGTNNITENIIKNISSKLKNPFAKAATFVVGSGLGEFPEESGQAILGAILQKYILGVDVETIFDDPIGQLSSAAYDGFIGFLSGTLMGIGNATTGFRETSMQNIGNQYNSIFAKADIKVENIAQYFIETAEKGSDLFEKAQTVLNGNKSDIAVGEMMNEALKESDKANDIIYTKIGENVKSRENGVYDIITEYQKLSKNGLIFPSKVTELYDNVMSFGIDDEIPDRLIGEFSLAVQTYTPRALLMREMLVKVDGQNSSLQNREDNDIIRNDQYVGDEANGGQHYSDSSQRIGGQVRPSENQTGAIQETDGGVYGVGQENHGETGKQSDLSNQANNRKIEPTTEESLKTTAIKDEDGNPKTVYHFTDNMDFTTFAFGDIGFHFGSLEQARQHKENLRKKNKLKGEGRFIIAHLDIKNPIYVSSDIMTWWPAHTALRLCSDGVISEEEYIIVRDLHIESGHAYDSPAAIELRKILAHKGYDGIVYQNNDFFEGEGESYIAFYPEQVIIIDDGKSQADPNGPANFMPEGENGGKRKRHHTTKAEQDFIKRICDKLGVKMKFIHITSELLAEKGYEFEDGILPDGFYDKDTDTLYIGFTVIDPVKFVFKHELTHFGEGTEQYAKFVEAVKKSKAYKEWLSKRTELNPEKNSMPAIEGAVRRKYIDARKQEIGFGPAKAEAEMIADFVGEYLFNEDGSTIEALLSGLNHKERNAVIQYILDFLSYLKKKLQGESNLVFEISRLEDNFNRMLFEAVQTKKEPPTENGGDLKFSFSDTNNSESKFIIDTINDNINSISPKSIFSVEGEKIPEGMKKTQYVLNIFDEQGNIAKNEEFGFVELVQSGAKSTVFHGFGAEKLAATKAIKTVIEQGDIIKTTRNYNNTGVDRYVMAAKGTIDGQPAFVGLIIKAYPNQKNQNAKFYLHEAAIIKTDSPIMTAPQLSVDTVSESVTINSISDNQSTVNNNYTQKSSNNSKGNIQFSFARPYDMSLVEEAEAEEAKWRAENKSERVIRRKVWDKTGLIRDSSGEWVYEIPDDQMKVYLDGDAINALGDDYKEFLALDRLKRLTPEKRKRYRELYDKYGAPWDRKYKLENFITHDELFAKYPQLRDYDVHICFLGSDADGGFDSKTKTISIDWELVEEAKKLKEEAEDFLDLEFSDIKVRETLIHEIQHAIQDIEQRENGASIKYWKNELDSGRMPINPKTKKPYTPREAYKLTKGEYEARQSEERLLKKEGARKEKVPDFGWGKTLSAKKSEAASSLKFSVPTNSEYMSAVKENDTEKLRQMVDNKARAEGYTERLYHQTGADFTEFNTDNPKAGKYDWELPTGTFLKPSNDDIGLEGKKQMELYAKLQNPLEFEDRIDAQRFWRENIPGYEKAADDIIKVDIEYGDKLNSAASQSRRYLKEWKQNNPDSNNRDIYKDGEYLRLKDIEDSISDEWESQVNELSLVAKKLVDDYISETDYDGIIVEKDQDGIKRQTKTYIVFDANQLKDAAPVTYDDNGNVIPLSQRFDSEQSDIRFSVPSVNRNFTEEMNALNQELQNGKISMDEFKSKVDILFKQAGETHGTIKKGETVTGKENFDNPVPKSVDDNTKIRQYTRTILEGGQLTEEMLSVTKQMILSGELSYTPTTNEKNQAAADKIIESGHAEDRWNKIANCEAMPNSQSITLGGTLLRNAIDRKDAVAAVKLMAEVTEVGTRLGQSVQALSLLKRMDGIGQLYYVQKAVNTLNNDLKQKYKKNPVTININEELALQLAESKTKEDFEITYTAILNDIASQVPSTFLDKFNAWRYLAMLANPITHIKNFGGNAVFLPAVKIKDIIAYGGERFIDQSKRTKSVVIKKEYKEFAKNDFSEVEDVITSGGKMNPKRSIADNKPIFKNKVLENIRNFNFDMLEKEDAIFLKAHYIRALGGYLQARELNLKTISPTVLQSAREYAILEAQKATFRDASVIANWLAKGSQKTLIGNILIEGTLPFKKTSANVLKRSVEYSPVGLITTVGKAIRDFSSSNFTASQFIDGLASNLTGTGIFVFGMWLATSGIIRGGSDGDDEDWFDKMLGKQDYSVEIGGISYTIDFLAPASVPFFMGVSVMESILTEDNTATLPDVLKSLGEGLSPIVELSMLSGVQSALETIRYSEPKELLPNLIINSAESYALQMLPTLGTKFANLIDPARRSNYIDKTSPVPKFLQSVGNKAAGKIPFASKLKAEYINAWGEKENKGDFVTRLFQNFISPGYLSKVDIDNIDAEIKRLAKATANMSVFPDTTPKYIKFKNVTKHLNRDDYEIYAVAKGQLSADYIKEAIESEEYQKLNDEQKAEVITNLYAFANAKAKAKLIYSYEELSVMNEGVTEKLYKGYSEKVKIAIAEEYFLRNFKTVSNKERNGGSAVEHYIDLAKRD